MGRPPTPTEGLVPASVTSPLCHPVDVAEIDRSPHRVERLIQQVLTSQPGLKVSNLVIRRIDDGVCLTGFIEAMDDQTDVCDLVKQVAGVNAVMNRLLVRSGTAG